MKKVILSLILAVGVFGGAAAAAPASHGDVQPYMLNHGVGG
ncbi:hypothetical protein [Paenibacillus zeisoli]|nr:hypothetical protein [Paenibacillus zeisoli]